MRSQWNFNKPALTGNPRLQKLHRFQQKGKEREVAAESRNLRPQTEGSNKSWIPSFLHIEVQMAAKKKWLSPFTTNSSYTHTHTHKEPVDFKTTNSKPGPSLALDFPVTW